MPAIENFAAGFTLVNGKTWLNCAHQGPLPKAAAAEALEAVSWKQQPYELTTERFSGVPQRVRQALGHLIGVASEEIILGNSASYGMHLLANGIPWKPGDEVLLVKGDFPSVLLPWMGLSKRGGGVTVRQIDPSGTALTVDELRAHLTPATRVFCTTWVHSFRGHALDLDALGAVCRSNGVTFIVNTSQGLGARPLNVRETPVDAITNVGFKWLCGPYGTGFCWMRSELRDSLDYNQAYWLSMLTADDLSKPLDDLTLREDLGARKYDVFGTANFFNFKPWAASIEYLLDIGFERIAVHDQSLVSRFLEGLDQNRYVVQSPMDGPSRSTLVLLSHKKPDLNEKIYTALIDAGVYGAHRGGSLRIAPHLHNTNADIDRALEVLNGFDSG